MQLSLLFISYSSICWPSAGPDDIPHQVSPSVLRENNLINMVQQRPRQRRSSVQTLQTVPPVSWQLRVHILSRLDWSPQRSLWSVEFLPELRTPELVLNIFIKSINISSLKKRECEKFLRIYDPLLVSWKLNTAIYLQPFQNISDPAQHCRNVSSEHISKGGRVLKPVHSTE